MLLSRCLVSTLLLIISFNSLSQDTLREERPVEVIYDTVFSVHKTYDTIMVVDTVFEYEYEFVDTLKVKTDTIQPLEIPKESNHKNAIQFSLGSDVSLNSAPNSYQYSLSYRREINRSFSVTSGLAYYHLRYPVDDSLGLIIKSYEEFKINEYTGWITDTIDFFYQIQNNDTIWFPITRQIWTKRTDSIPYTRMDSIRVNAPKEKINKIGMIEVPISMNYKICSIAFLNISAFSTLIPGISIFRKEYILNIENESFVLESNHDYKFSLRMKLGIEVDVPVNQLLNAFVQAGYSSYLVKPYEGLSLNGQVSVRLGIIKYF